MSLKPADGLAQKLIFFFLARRKTKYYSITGCPNKFLMGTQDTHKKKK